MKSREQIYSRECAGILRDVSMYRTLAGEQLLRLYPGRERQVENLLAYLVRQKRVFQTENGLYCASEEAAETIDKGLFAAVWVLADFIDRVEYHSIGDYPAKAIFFADGEVYEIVHVPCGKETLISQVLSTAEASPPNYIILVEKPEQIAEIHAPNVSGYCTVSEAGEVQYYQKE